MGVGAAACGFGVADLTVFVTVRTFDDPQPARTMRSKNAAAPAVVIFRRQRRLRPEVGEAGKRLLWMSGQFTSPTPRSNSGLPGMSSAAVFAKGDLDGTRTTHGAGSKAA